MTDGEVIMGVLTGLAYVVLFFCFVALIPLLCLVATMSWWLIYNIFISSPDKKEEDEDEIEGKLCYHRVKSSGLMPWAGGEAPCKGSTMVKAWFRDGSKTQGLVRADTLDWEMRYEDGGKAIVGWICDMSQR